MKLNRSGHYEKAAEYFDRLPRAGTPNEFFAPVWEEISRCYRKAGQNDKADEALARAKMAKTSE